MKLNRLILLTATMLISSTTVHSADRQPVKPQVGDVLKESYSEKTGDLKNAAQKVKTYNKKKKKIRDKLSKRRTLQKKKD